MKKLTYSLALTGLMAFFAFIGGSAFASFKTGEKVWSKHLTTNLLTEPRPLAAVQTTVGFAEKLTVREVQGSWLRVKTKAAEGWIFQGNVAGQKPEIAPAAGLTQIDASTTNTVAAARPLTPAANDYAARRGQQSAQADIDWIDQQASLLTADAVIAWMSANQKGEYQP